MDAQLTILDEVEARLLGMTSLNGYRFDLVANSLKRASLKPFKNGDLPAVNYFPTVDTITEKTGQFETRSFQLTIEAYDKTRDEPFTDGATKLATDIIDSLFRSTSAPLKTDPVSLKLGGLVESIVVDSQTPMIGEGQSPWFGTLLDITIKYSIKVGDFSTIISN